MKDNMKKLSSFFAGKGFYLVLVLCIAVIGVSAGQIWRVTQRVSSVNSDVLLEEPVTTPAVSPSPSPTTAPKPSTSPVPPAASEKPVVEVVEEPEEAPEVSQKPTASAYIWPVKGAVIADFSLEVQAWDETMGDWRTHDGIDIACDLGTVVTAAGAGTVSEVYVNDLMGTTVAIDHGNGVLSIYSNLAAEPNVKEGDEVAMGDTVGSVGSTAKAESRKANHLHFEMKKDGEAVDPMNYLPK